MTSRRRINGRHRAPELTIAQRIAIAKELLDLPRTFRTVSIVKQLAAKLGISPSTLYGWVRRYREGGADAFYPKRRADYGVSRFFANHLLAAAFVTNLSFEPLSIADIHEQLRRELGAECCSYETTRVFVEDVREKLNAREQGSPQP